MNAEFKALLDDAIHQVDTLKHPDIEEFQVRLDEILEAAGLGRTNRDSIKTLSFVQGTLYLTTAYSCRGCAMSDDYKVPKEILDADDPVAYARQWRQARELAKAELAVANARKVLDERLAALATLKATDTSTKGTV